jgi:L-lactate dehydrogenase complex protein LldG
MSARSEVFERLRAVHVERVALPSLDGEWIRYADRVEQFGAAVALAKGSVVRVQAGGTVREAIEKLGVAQGAERRCSLIPEIASAFDPGSATRAFADLDLVIARGEFGVAENGAIWLDPASASVRGGLFLAQHLVLVLPEAEIVDNLHQAYERLGNRLGQASYGCFMSGPSKTADIEQALVVGAHGPRSLTVVLY